jgi:hypothetical protein
MVNFFDSIYNSTVSKNRLLERIRFYSLLRFLIRLCANTFIPAYYVLTRKEKKYSLGNCLQNDRRVIVSLTSFPARINRVWIVIESLLRQETKPDMIILWLSIEQFSTLESLPLNLKKLQARGLTIRLCENNLKSHKKYYYVMKEFPKAYIVTVDDDVIYNSKLLSFLIKSNSKYPNAICCNHAAHINVAAGVILPYLDWKTVNYEQYPTTEIMAIGMGGILYPPNSLISDVFNTQVFKRYCFQADDIWLNIMARLIGTKIAKTPYSSFYLPIINFKNITLASKNVNEEFNDEQLKSVRTYYIRKYGIDPYQDILNNGCKG